MSGETQEKGHVRDRVPWIFHVAQRQVPAGVINELLVGGIGFSELPLKGTAAHVQLLRHLFLGKLTGGELVKQVGLAARGDVVLVQRRELRGEDAV